MQVDDVSEEEDDLGSAKENLFLPWLRSEETAMTIRHPSGLLLLFLLGYQAVARGKNKLPHEQNTLESQDSN